MVSYITSACNGTEETAIDMMQILSPFGKGRAVMQHKSRFNGSLKSNSFVNECG
jgi:hypothetical protein